MSAVSGNGASSDHNVAIYSILVDGSQIDPTLAKSIREIKIQSYLRLPDTCTFDVGYETGQPGGDQPIDSNPFDIGAELEVKLGAADDLTTPVAVQGPDRLAGAELRRRRRRVAVPRLRPLPRPDPLAERADVPEHDLERHRHEARPGRRIHR